MSFQINIKIVIPIILAIFYTQPVFSQSYEELDETVSGISSAIGVMRGDISSLFSVSDYFTSGAKDNYRKKLKELTRLDLNKVPYHQTEWLKKNKYTVSNLSNDKFFLKNSSSWNRKIASDDVTKRYIGDYGNGNVQQRLDVYKVNTLCHINNLNLENAFNESVKHEIIDGFSPKERLILESDIRAIPLLINFLSEYPDAIDIYCKLADSEFRTDLKLLYFFAYEFITDESGIKKREKIDHKKLDFDVSQKNSITVIYNGNILATLSKDEMNIIDPIILNYTFPPNYKINYKGISFITDNLKRITHINLSVEPNITKIANNKKYDIKKFNKNKHSQYSFLIPEKIGGHKVLENAFDLDNKKNKQQMKYIEKSYKMAQKQGDENYMVYTLYYESGNYEPSYIKVELSNPIETKNQIYGQRVDLR